MPLREAFDSPAETPHSYWKQAGVYLTALKGSKYVYCFRKMQLLLVQLR